MPANTESERCTGCGGPRNHFVDGKLRAKCAKCNDYADRAKSSRGPAVFSSKSRERDVAEPTLTPAARDLLRQIDELLEDERYEWAADTLEGIKSTVSRTGRCTDGQQRAVRNIEDSKLKERR
jgi:hypothetical protein